MARGDWQLCQIPALARQGARGQPAAKSAGLSAAPAAASCTWQGCGTHQLDPPCLGGCIITEPALSCTANPAFHPLVLLLPSQATEPDWERSKEKEKVFSPSPARHIHKTPLSFFRASPPLAPPAALPAPLSPRYIGQSFCTASKPSLQICLCPQCSSPCCLPLPNISTPKATVSRDIWTMAHEQH